MLNVLIGDRATRTVHVPSDDKGDTELLNVVTTDVSGYQIAQLLVLHARDEVEHVHLHHRMRVAIHTRCDLHNTHKHN